MEIYYSFIFLVLTVSPQSVTVPLNEKTNFTCKGNGNEINWLVKSVIPTESIKQQRNITIADISIGSNLSSILSVMALPINDNLKIGCQIISFSPFKQLFSNTSTLKIRG